MSFPGWCRNIWRAGRGQPGIALAETLVAVAIMALVSVAFLSALGTTLKGTAVAEERAVADKLARNQMEYVKNLAYISYAVTGHGEYGAIAAPVNYSVDVSTIPVDPATGLALGPEEDQGLQKIVVSVSVNGRSLATVEGYKVNR
ncbi:MAG: hypothetical protein HYY29_02045 [Chloroflexi bacterium]|nr:hypothetical protein [Chloroflexota bacterium]